MSVLTVPLVMLWLVQALGVSGITLDGNMVTGIILGSVAFGVLKGRVDAALSASQEATKKCGQIAESVARIQGHLGIKGETTIT